MAPKRKRSALATVAAPITSNPIPIPDGPTYKADKAVPSPKRQRPSRTARSMIATNPDENPLVLDGPDAVRASPDGEVDDALAPHDREESPLSDLPDEKPVPKKRGGKKATKAAEAEVQTPAKSKPKADIGIAEDPEAESNDEAGEDEILAASLRPPPVNSDYLPLPWKGRLGYACLNTYLRCSNPPVFSSRTCRIASILEHRHPLKDPSQPEHSTKNRPDKEKSADIARGQRWVESLGLANARDIIKMLRWNDKYGIKFMRLSSEMFPFASHDEYGYKLAPFAAETLAQVGKVVAELGHRVTTHPGQFTQLGSPRKVVVANAIRDLEYHDELLSLLKLPPQQDRDAVMILHMGGMFGSKSETLDRFRENYAGLSDSIKKRLVLENDDMGWSVHDLLPICQDLNIPLVLDFHHHNIVFDADNIREGTKDIVDMFPVIRETWTRKKITQKMHYSEQTPKAITPNQRRKHSPRVATLPPCADDMDLMIEAKDKEQAVFELMRTFKLPGFERINDIVPHVRRDDNKNFGKAAKAAKATPKKKGVKKEVEETADEVVPVKEEQDEEVWIEDVELGMGGPHNRVYWPQGMEEWLRPKKREVKKKEPEDVAAAAKKAKTPKRVNGVKSEETETAAMPTVEDVEVKSKTTATAKKVKAKAKTVKKESVPTPSSSGSEESDAMEDDENEKDIVNVKAPMKAARPSRRGKRAAGVTSYAEADDSE